MANYITNQFNPYDANNTAVPGFKWNDTLGGTPTYTDPKTGVERKLGWGPTGPEGDYTYDETGQANPISGQQMGYGFLDENPWLSPNSATFIKDPHPKDSGTFNTTLGLLGVVGGAVGAGLGAAGAGSQAFPYSTGSLGWDAGGDALLGGAGSDVFGGTSMSNMADEFGNFDMGSGTTGTDAFTGGNAGAGGISQFLQSLGLKPADALKIAGQLGSSALGYFGANKQAGQLQNLANQYSAYGGPSRARFDASMTPGFNPTSIPGYAGALDTATKGILAKLSATGGNPFGNPGALIDAEKQLVSGTALPAIQNYQALNANTGFGNSMQLAGNLGQQAIGADANSLNALGYGINAATNPTPSLADLLALISKSGFKMNEGL